jgi:hypothetical protein
VRWAHFAHRNETRRVGARADKRDAWSAKHEA